MNKQQLQEKTQEILKKYWKIYKILFTYGIFIIIGVFVIFKIYNILNKQANLIYDINSLDTIKQKTIQEFFKKINKKNTLYFFSGEIITDDIQEENEIISSYNNLVTYKWFIVPRFFSITKTAPIQPLPYFQKWTYTKEEMAIFFKNIILWSKWISKETKLNTLFPINKNLIEEFNLQCLFEKKITNSICDIFTEKFIKEFFIYNIEQDNINIEPIFNNIIKQKKHKEKMCQNLLYYTYYTNSQNITIQNFLENCWSEYKDSYITFTNFIDVQNELYNKFISNKIYKNEKINIYKLISFQQIIYEDIKNNRLNIDSLNWYFSFIQEILKRNQIWNFYKEVIYYFNNYYIKENLQKTEIIKNITNKFELNEIEKQIININNWNKLIGYNWLKDQINKNILQNDFIITNTGENNTEQNNENQINLIENLLQQINIISINKKIISWNTIKIEWDWNLETKIPLEITLEEEKNTLYVKNIVLIWFTEITESINKLCTSQKRSFSDLQKYIEQNKTLFWEVGQEIQEEEINKLCTTIKILLPRQELKTCNKTNIDIDVLWKNNIITITFLHNNFILNKIDVSDEEARKIINNIIQTSNTDQSKEKFALFIKSIIQWLLTYVPETSNNSEWSINSIIIIERVKQFLWITVSDIVEKNNKVLIDFIIQWISFIGYYNIEDHKIEPIYFKKIDSNNIPLLIKNLSLTLNDENKIKIDNFVSDPLKTIKEISPEEFIIYQKFTSENTK